MIYRLIRINKNLLFRKPNLKQPACRQSIHPTKYYLPQLCSLYNWTIGISVKLLVLLSSFPLGFVLNIKWTQFCLVQTKESICLYFIACFIANTATPCRLLCEQLMTWKWVQISFTSRWLHLIIFMQMIDEVIYWLTSKDYWLEDGARQQFIKLTKK